MPRDAFVDPNTIVLNLTEGDWIEVKERLTYGEQQRLASASLTSVQIKAGRSADADTEINLDMQRHAIERIRTWVVDWSFRDKNGKQVKITQKTIENLKPDIADEINAKLDEYIELIEAGGSPEGKLVDTIATVTPIESKGREAKSS